MFKFDRPNVPSGITLFSFQFYILWSGLSRQFGDVISLIFLFDLNHGGIFKTTVCDNERCFVKARTYLV